MRYKYVIRGVPKVEFYKLSYSDIEKTDNAVYLCDEIQTNSKVLNWLYTRHFGERINKVVDLPLKGIWNRLYYKNDFDKKDSESICFVLFPSYLEYVKYGLIEDIRKDYPGCKIVCFYQDLAITKKGLAPEKAKDVFDLVLSFDHKDCETYGFTYYPLVYSCTEIEDDPSIPESDVFFLGKAKNRLPEILEAYEKFRDAGLVCDFHITGVPESERKYADEINYCDKMSYKENLKRIKKTRCMLEIMQQGGHGYTLRYCEAIAHGRRLITNNTEIKNAPFYNPEFISTFTTADEIDMEFVRNGKQDVDYKFKEELSPIKLIEFIDNYFSNNDQRDLL